MKQGAKGDPTVGLREWLDELAEVNNALFAEFDTRAEMVCRLPGPAAKTAAKIARSGYALLTRPESFYVLGTPGPLLDGEIQRAEAWGAQLAESLVRVVRDWG